MSTSDPNDDDDDRPRRRPLDDDDDRPSRRRRAADDEEDDRPAGRRSYDERDDFDDLPSRPRGQPGDGLAIASMIVGIVAVIGATVAWCCCGYFGSGGAALIGIVAVLLGFVSRSQGSRSGMGMTGLILGFAAIALGIIMTILLIIGIAWLEANQGQFGPGPGGGPGGGGIQKNKF